MNIMELHYLPRGIMYSIMIMMILMLIASTTNIIFSQSLTNSLTFDDPLIGVKFQYTDEWIKEGSYSLFGAESECSSLPCKRLPEISVSTSPIVYEDFSLENYTKEERSYHEDSQGYKPIALNKTKIGKDMNAFQYIYRTTSPFLSENDDIINHEIYTTKGINLYKISFTALLNEQYDKYLNSFKKMMDTFEIVR
jgi:hypothetical protein